MSMPELVSAAKAALVNETAKDLADRISDATVTVEIIDRAVTALLRRSPFDRVSYTESLRALGRLRWAMKRDAVATRRIVARLKVGDRLDRAALKDLQRQVRDEWIGEGSSRTSSGAHGCLWTVEDPRYGGVEILIDDRGYWTTAERDDPSGMVRRVAAAP